MFSKKGNTAGFTNDGFPVCGGYSNKSRQWDVYVDRGFGPFTNSSRRQFDTLAQASAYAAPLIDAVKTAELKWW